MGCPTARMGGLTGWRGSWRPRITPHPLNNRWPPGKPGLAAESPQAHHLMSLLPDFFPVFLRLLVSGVASTARFGPASPPIQGLEPAALKTVIGRDEHGLGHIVGRI